MRRLIPTHHIQIGARYFVVPRDESTPRGPKLGAIPKAGADLAVDDYLFGAIQRGAALAYGPKEPATPEPATPPAQPMEDDDNG